MGFWIKGCLSSSRASVLINDSATKEFSISKGVRQGDPLSPFIFIIVIESLNVAIKSTCQNALFRGIKLPNCGPSISHLFHADDVLFVGEWLSSNFDNLARILRCFQANLRLKVNFNKSQVFGIGVSIGEITGGAHILGCCVTSLPFKYLGIPAGANMALQRHWQPILDRVRSRLSSLKARTL